jgi:hypothetical protein
MTFNHSVPTRDTKKATERKMRETGFDDGYAGRPAALTLLVYQQSYRRGVDARKGDAA